MAQKMEGATIYKLFNKFPTQTFPSLRIVYNSSDNDSIETDPIP